MVVLHVVSFVTQFAVSYKINMMYIQCKIILSYTLQSVYVNNYVIQCMQLCSFMLYNTALISMLL